MYAKRGSHHILSPNVHKTLCTRRLKIVRFFFTYKESFPLQCNDLPFKITSVEHGPLGYNLVINVCCNTQITHYGTSGLFSFVKRF